MNNPEGLAAEEEAATGLSAGLLNKLPSPPGVRGFEDAATASGFLAAIEGGFVYPLGFESKSPLP